MEKAIPLSAFFKLLHDTANDGFSIRFRKVDGDSSEKTNCRKSRKRYEGKAVGKIGLRYDIIEKGLLLLEDGSGQFFSCRNRLITHYRPNNESIWYRIKRNW